jgi:hypothetical protein
MIRVALVESGLEKRVTRGENRGHTLVHSDVVRAFVSAPGNGEQGEVTLTVPAGLNPAKAHLVAFLQDDQSLRITGAVAAAYPSQ